MILQAPTFSTSTSVFVASPRMILTSGNRETKSLWNSVFRSTSTRFWGETPVSSSALVIAPVPLPNSTTVSRGSVIAALTIALASRPALGETAPTSVGQASHRQNMSRWSDNILCDSRLSFRNQICDLGRGTNRHPGSWNSGTRTEEANGAAAGPNWLEAGEQRLSFEQHQNDPLNI